MTLTVTTSWDDGALQDLRLAELLARHALPATFYVPRENPERPVLDAAGLKELAQGFELGAHTLTHADLTRPGASMTEVTEGRAWLQDLIGREVTAFCFPQGRHDARARAWVRDAGFRVARTADWFRDALRPGEPVLLEPTIHAYPQPFLVHVAHSLRTRNWASFGHYLPLATSGWESLARRSFDACLARGGVFHLWGHAWEIDALGLWEPLARVLAHIAGRPGVRYVTNGALA